MNNFLPCSEEEEQSREGKQERVNAVFLQATAQRWRCHCPYGACVLAAKAAPFITHSRASLSSSSAPMPSECLAVPGEAALAAGRQLFVGAWWGAAARGTRSAQCAGRQLQPLLSISANQSHTLPSTDTDNLVGSWPNSLTALQAASWLQPLAPFQKVCSSFSSKKVLCSTKAHVTQTFTAGVQRAHRPRLHLSQLINTDTFSLLITTLQTRVGGLAHYHVIVSLHFTCSPSAKPSRTAAR